MKIGFIGLGKMGMGMTERLLSNNHQVIVYNRSIDKVKIIEEKGATGAASLEELVDKLPTPKVVWLMLPAGQATVAHINRLAILLNNRDILIDGGNSFYKDSIKTTNKLNQLGINFLDIGISGGIQGREKGYCIMVGGENTTFNYVEPILKSLAQKNGYAYIGKNGSGHFVKMIHNAIEYGMMQAYAEGFELLQAKKDLNIDLAQIAHLWNQGSVVRSWLLELTEQALITNPTLAKVSGYIEDSGEGRWAAIEAIESSISAPIITHSLLERFRSRYQETFAAKLIAVLRNKFGGHAIK